MSKTQINSSFPRFLSHSTPSSVVSLSTFSSQFSGYDGDGMVRGSCGSCAIWSAVVIQYYGVVLPASLTTLSGVTGTVTVEI